MCWSPAWAVLPLPPTWAHFPLCCCSWVSSQDTSIPPSPDQVHSQESISTPAGDGDKGRWAIVTIRAVMVKEQRVTGPKYEPDPGPLCLISPFHAPCGGVYCSQRDREDSAEQRLGAGPWQCSPYTGASSPR